MGRRALGLILMSVVAVMVIGAQSALAGPVQSVTACLKVEPGQPLGTAVYSWWDDETRRLEIDVAGAENGTYCISIDKVHLDVKFTVEAGVGSLRLDTRWGDFIPPVDSGSNIILKDCTDKTIVLCGMFK